MEVETQIAFVTIMMSTGNEEQTSPERNKISGHYIQKENKNKWILLLKEHYVVFGKQF